MASVTGLTAARMLGIEAASVVDGDVDVNGNLILTKHDGSTVNAGYVKGSPGNTGAPGPAITGFISMYGAAVAPAGYLICDGSLISRSIYSALFLVIGTNYGVGDGSTTFALPSSTNMFPRGNTPGPSGGASTHSHTLTAASASPHAHTSAAHAHAHTGTHSHLLTAGYAMIGIFSGLLRNQQGNSFLAWTGNNKISATTSGDAVATNTGTRLGGSSSSDSPGPTDSVTPGVSGMSTPGLVGSTDTGNNLPPYFGVNFIIKT